MTVLVGSSHTSHSHTHHTHDIMVAYTLVLSVRVLKNRVVQQAKSPRVCFVVHLFNQHKEEKIGDRAVLENFAPFGIQEAAASLYMGIRGFSGRLGL